MLSATTYKYFRDYVDDAEMGTVLGGLYGAAHAAVDAVPDCDVRVEMSIDQNQPGYRALWFKVDAPTVAHLGPMHKQWIDDARCAAYAHLERAMGYRR